MAKTSIIRSVYADRFLYHLDNMLLFNALCNTDFQGDPAGGSVIINSMTDPSVSTYAGTATVADLVTTSQTLSIDKAKYFAVLCDDWDKVRTNLNLVEESAKRGAYALANSVDGIIASMSYNEGTAVAFGALGAWGSPYVPTGSTGAGSSYDMVVDLNVALSNAGAPQDNRFCVLPAFAIANISKDSRILTNNPVILANGLVQGVNVNGMQIYHSNNLLTSGSTSYCVIAGQGNAMAFVGAVKELETFRSPTSFGDVVRGLYGFGFCVTQDTSVATVVIKAT